MGHWANASSKWKSVVVIVLLALDSVATAEKKVPAIFIFGDSLVEAGNNNYLLWTYAKSNYKPYGVDFRDGPTGRFSNGRTAMDVVADILGVPYPRPFMEPHLSPSNISHGLNYASGGAGILELTGANLGMRIPFAQQITAFAFTRSKLRKLLGPAEAADLVGKSLFTITIGSNDYLNNYFVEHSSAAALFTPEEFQNLLVTIFSTQLTVPAIPTRVKHLYASIAVSPLLSLLFCCGVAQSLYLMGARKFFITNVGPLGCIPHFLVDKRWERNKGTCIEELNKVVEGFNEGLRRLVSQLNGDLFGSKFIIGDFYTEAMRVISNPKPFGFHVVHKACCGEGQMTCPANATVCNERDAYLFWDPFHPCDRANSLLGHDFVYGPSSAVWPLNIMQVVEAKTEGMQLKPCQFL